MLEFDFGSYAHFEMAKRPFPGVAKSSYIRALEDRLVRSFEQWEESTPIQDEKIVWQTAEDDACVGGSIGTRSLVDHFS